jgi:NAD(P)-dependent dehydrogenase (short-subunit alcohol dehydrogenase family)
MGRLDGKVALVTGGASGIGAAVVRRFSEEGAAVVVADLADEPGEALAASLRATGSRVVFQHTDVGELAQVEAAVATAVERFGGLDVLHNNAARSGGGHLHTIDPAIWEDGLRIMLTAAFYGMRAAIPAMLARGGGSIINTASVEAFQAEMMAAPYNTAKAGLLNLSRTAAIEYGRRGIRSNCICPGVVDTPMFALMLAVSPRSRAEVANRHALGRVLRPEEIANVALFLASDESSGMTGAALVVDGGLTANTDLSGFPPFEG